MRAGHYGVEIEQRFHELGIVRSRIDHLDRHVAAHRVARTVDVHILHRDGAERGDASTAGIDRFGQRFGRRSAIRAVVFDAKIAVGPPGLWLADRMIPPNARCLRITQETAGV